MGEREREREKITNQSRKEHGRAQDFFVAGLGIDFAFLFTRCLGQIVSFF